MSLMQTNWSTKISPVLDNPIVNGLILNNIVLINGATTINHKLGRKLQGWLLIGVSAAATIYDSQATNQQPDLTLVLHSNAACTVNLYVF